MWPVTCQHAIASMEYAIATLDTALIIVLGYDACGAVGATIKPLKHITALLGRLPSLVISIAPAVNAISPIGRSGLTVSSKVHRGLAMYPPLQTALPKHDRTSGPGETGG